MEDLRDPLRNARPIVGPVRREHEGGCTEKVIDRRQGVGDSGMRVGEEEGKEEREREGKEERRGQASATATRHEQELMENETTAMTWGSKHVPDTLSQTVSPHKRVVGCVLTFSWTLSSESGESTEKQMRITCESGYERGLNRS